MRKRNAAIAVVTLSLSAFLVGKGWWKPEVEETPPPELADFELASLERESPVRDAAATAAPSPELKELRLKVGDGFPFIRTIDQTVTQQTSAGVVTGKTSLELFLNLRVEEVREQSRRVRVRYDRVRYLQDVAGEKVELDSATAQSPVPLAAKAYLGLVNNWFDLWIGPDNRPASLEGFDLFLKRCVRDVPAEERHAFSVALAGISPDDSIASFIDESIGLLPYIVPSSGEPAAPQIGTRWEQARHVDGPLPLDLINACTLTAIDGRSAKIEIVGEIHPSRSSNPPVTGETAQRVAIRGGRTIGHCIIELDSGLPLESKIERTLDMTVNSPEGIAIPQQKLVITTIRALPPSSSGEPYRAPTVTATHEVPSTSQGTIMKTSYEQPVSSGRTNR